MEIRVIGMPDELARAAEVIAAAYSQNSIGHLMQQMNTNFFTP
jgi:hypothetical protein